MATSRRRSGSISLLVMPPQFAALRPSCHPGLVRRAFGGLPRQVWLWTLRVRSHANPCPLGPGYPQRPRHATPTRKLKGPFARLILKRWRALHAPILLQLTDPGGAQLFWQPGGGYDRSVRRTDSIQAIYEYVHMNPVVAGLVMCPQDWAWSSVGTANPLAVDRLQSVTPGGLHGSAAAAAPCHLQNGCTLPGAPLQAHP